MSNMDKAFFIEKCKTIRCLIMEGIASIGSGHIGGCLSCVEALTVLRYKLMQGLDRKIRTKRDVTVWSSPRDMQAPRCTLFWRIRATIPWNGSLR